MNMHPDVDGILGLTQGGELSLDPFRDADYEEDDDDDDMDMESKDDSSKIFDDDEDNLEQRVDDYVKGSLFVNGLFDAEKITHKQFSFYLADES